ncbi:DUF3626 domain-containing protein [Photobacterium sp. OFAV2-7]|uniref:DUF3626 domain-containing protein n=1 Tax=Photobacterium sp. OFAV2-7 TaxID=2917748 RepID=UPI001EF4D195|nr:DUF3626 domain-containing protein [Photobacterium sp. OFAV2-7]MCG7584848.1 DUF3626 domain-containing protein [Photobacterium sp. OFAV2-7]
MQLTQAQARAISFVTQQANNLDTHELRMLEHILHMSNLSQSDVSTCLDSINHRAPIAVHFHPDRIGGNGCTVAQSMMALGRYLNQFESLISNGKLDPCVGGERAEWENHLFGDVFSDTDLSERPKYGALDLFRHPDGPCPRFGSCYFVLSSAVSHRSTFCFGDSYLMPSVRGTMAEFTPILASLLTESFDRETALGLKDIRPVQMMKRLSQAGRGSGIDFRQSQPVVRNLDHYIEAQIHGQLDLASDVELLVADSSFQGTTQEEDLRQLCERYQIQLMWRPGYRLPVAKVPEDFRGPEMISLARRVAIDGEVTAYAIGVAARTLVQNNNGLPEQQLSDALQHLKLLWHVLVRFGQT